MFFWQRETKSNCLLSFCLLKSCGRLLSSARGVSLVKGNCLEAEQAVILTGNSETGNRNKLTDIFTSLGKSADQSAVVCRLQREGKGGTGSLLSVPVQMKL